MDAGREHELIVLWQKSWRRCDFEPVVLTHLHAEAHPQFTQYDTLVRSFPSINPKEYEVACWHRWLAADVVRGGLFVDYDVIARAFAPEMVLELPNDVTVLDRGGVPCAVWLTDVGAAQVVQDVLTRPHGFATFSAGRHYSDMYYFQARNDPKAPHLTAPFGAPDWENAPAVHFSHGDCGREAPGESRKKIIERTMEIPIYYFPTPQSAELLSAA